MLIIAARNVPCPVCGAKPHENCRYMYARGRAGEQMLSSHSERVWDAQWAQQAANALLGE